MSYVLFWTLTGTLIIGYITVELSISIFVDFKEISELNDLLVDFIV